jgi:AraC-like DNA-binding protein
MVKLPSTGRMIMMPSSVVISWISTFAAAGVATESSLSGEMPWFSIVRYPPATYLGRRLRVKSRADPQAARCREFVRKPAIHATIDDWASDLHMSPRAFTRLFRRETGLSFMAWRQQACLIGALPRLSAGEPVTSVAMDLGYENPAAFTLIFKRAFGSPPLTHLGLKGGEARTAA